jgi:hypothetical protein
MKAGRRRVNVFDCDEVALEQLLTNADPKIVSASKTAATRWRSEYSNAFNKELCNFPDGEEFAGTTAAEDGNCRNCINNAREQIQSRETPNL